MIKYISVSRREDKQNVILKCWCCYGCKILVYGPLSDTCAVYLGYLHYGTRVLFYGFLKLEQVQCSC